MGNNALGGQNYEMKHNVQVRVKRDGLLPLHVALLNNAKIDVVSRIYDLYPAAVMTPDRHGRLPMHCAMIGDVEVEQIKQLYFYHVDSLAVADEVLGYTPLHYAVKFNREKHISFLISKYPQALNVKAKMFDEDGNEIFGYSQTQDIQNVSSGKNNTVKFSAGDTPLDMAEKDPNRRKIYQMMILHQQSTIENLEVM